MLLNAVSKRLAAVLIRWKSTHGGSSGDNPHRPSASFSFFVHCSVSFLSPNVLVRCCDQVEIQRRERPQVATINGVPTLLFTGVNPKSGNCWTQMQRIATK